MIFDTFSKRLKKQTATAADVYQYDNLPEQFRVQVAHILRAVLGHDNSHSSWYPHLWEDVHDLLAKEFGVFHLGVARQAHETQCIEFLLKADTMHALDVIEVAFRAAQLVETTDYRSKQRSITQNGVDAVQDLNYRFKEHGIGYQFEGGLLVRVDSQLLHAEVVKPALSILSDGRFKGANQEFLSGFEHFRAGRHKEAIVDALKAFESTMKTICDLRHWPYDAGATAKQLIAVVFAKGLVPPALQSEFTALASVLESGLPTVRNKTSGHGQGATPIVVPDYLAAYALHVCAANIVLLVNAHKAMA